MEGIGFVTYEEEMVERAMEAFWGPLDNDYDEMLALLLLKDRASREIDMELDRRNEEGALDNE